MVSKQPIELSAACKRQLATRFDGASRERAFEAIERWLRTPEAYPPSPTDHGGCTITVEGVILEARETPVGGIVIEHIVLTAVQYQFSEHKAARDSVRVRNAALGRGMTVMPDVAGNLAIMRDELDVSKRLYLPAQAIPVHDEWIGKIHAMWAGLRPGGRVPKWRDLDRSRLFGLSKGRIHIVDTLSGDPWTYWFRTWGTGILFDNGANYTALTLGSMPHTAMRKAALEDYADVVATGVPAYQLIFNREQGREHSYARLLLPFACDGRRVDRLLVCINQREIPEIQKTETFSLSQSGITLH
jgi:hypothetical protein